MPIGLRLAPENVDLAGFRAFIEARGAVHGEPLAANAEIMRFKVGFSIGRVSKRKDGILTFAGAARPLLEQWQTAARDARLLQGATQP